MTRARKLYITIKLPNNSEKYLQFHCEYVEYGFYYVVPMSMIFDQIFDEGHRSYVLQKEGSGEKFILDPTVLPVILPDNSYALSQFGVNICQLNKSKETIFNLVPREGIHLFFKLLFINFLENSYVNHSLAVEVNLLSAGIKNNLLIDVTLVFMRDGHVEVEKYPLNGWKSIFESLTRQKIVYRNPLNELKEVDVKAVTSSPDTFLATNGEVLYTKTCMIFEISDRFNNGAPATELIESFKTSLTRVGEQQLNGLMTLLSKMPNIVSSNAIYAPYMPLIQSSGYGKSKITDELLKIYPGVSMVFRNPDDSGYPRQPNWVNNFQRYIYAALNDVFPVDEDMYYNSNPSRYASGRFLLGLFRILQSYFRQFSRIYQSNQHDRAAAIRTIGEHFMSNNSNWLEELNFEESSALSMGIVVQYISRLLKPSTNDMSNDDSIFVGFTKEDVRIAFSEARNIPFLIFMDELACFDGNAAPGRLSGVHVVRRALHLLENPRLFVVAIGTNSDSWDFSPAIRDNSLRYPVRKNLLAPAWLSGNGDIFFNELELHRLEFDRDLLMNRNYMKVLLTMGRPLWSSIAIESVISSARIKLINGNRYSKESLMSYLLCRACMRISPSSVLTRTLVRSHMATVHFIDTDARSMKISYPSEPVLAIASRQILQGRETRSSAFRALAAFTQRQVVDRGRLVEAIHEHMVLFAIDDTRPCNDEYHLDNSGYSGALEKVLGCQSYLLAIDFSNVEERNENVHRERVNRNPNGIVVDPQSYLVIKVESFLKSLFGPENFEAIASMLPNREQLLNGYINATHFINFEESEEICNYFGENKREFKIDRALLKLLLMRFCALVLPAGQYGLDFILPVLLATPEGQRPVYSYIGFQSKSSMDFSQFEAVAKTNMHYNLRKCCGVGGCAQGVCQGGSGCYTDEEFSLITEDQLIILMSLDSHGLKKSLEKLTVYHKLYSHSTMRNPVTTTEPGAAPARPATQRRDTEVLKRNAIERARSIWRTNLLANADVRSVRKYPKMKSFNHTKPSLIVKKTFASNFENVNIVRPEFGTPITVQRMVWEGRNDRPQQALTCIVSHDLLNHRHLLDSIGSCRDVKNMVNDQNSVFTDVPKLHLDLVVDSCVNGSFSAFDQFNPHLRAARGLSPLSNPLEILPNYNSEKVSESIDRCIHRNSGLGEPL